jgi:hypothetical protein
MAKNAIATQYDDAGFPVVASQTVSLAYSAIPAVVKAAPGRLLKVIVTTATAGGSITIYDNASTNSGTILLVIPAAAAIGTVYDVNLPAANGIYAYQSAASAGVLCVSYA